MSKTRKNVIKFVAHDRPNRRVDGSATVIVLPVIRIERLREAKADAYWRMKRKLM